jgi:hypothetical protein
LAPIGIYLALCKNLLDFAALGKGTVTQNMAQKKFWTDDSVYNSK